MKKKEQLLTILEKIGLSDNESSAYLACLALGPTKVSSIAIESGIKRTTVYAVIEGLQKKGLVRREAKGMKNTFIPENPDRLETILEERNKEFQSLFPELRSLYNLEGDGAIIKYYDTPESIRNVYREVLSEIRNGDNYFVIGDPERYDNQNEKFFKNYIQKRIKTNLNAKLLLTNSDLSREYKKHEKNFGEEIKILPLGVSFDTNMVLTDKKLILHQIIDPHMTIVIENKSVIGLQQAVFKLLWEKY